MATETGTGKDASPQEAHDHREIKWKEAWTGVNVTHKKYQYNWNAHQRPDSAPAIANKRLALRLYQLKTGHRLTGQPGRCRN